VRAVPFDEHHGVRAHNMRGQLSKISLSNEGVRIQHKGILPSLATYFREREPTTIHSLQDIFFNLPCIHRTYCLTYKSQRDMFMPVTDAGFVFDRGQRQAFLALEISPSFPLRRFRLPPSLQVAPTLGPNFVRSGLTVSWRRRTRPSEAEIQALKDLHRQLRFDLPYINGAQTLWYVKAMVTGPKRLVRSTLTLMLAAMHRLSEICRYKPIELESYLAG